MQVCEEVPTSQIVVSCTSSAMPTYRRLAHGDDGCLTVDVVNARHAVWGSAAPATAKHR